MIYLGDKRIDFQMRPYKDPAGSGLMVGPVSDIRFSFIEGSLNVFWKDPSDLEIDHQIVAKWKGTRLVYKTTSIPNTETDGTIVGNFETRDEHNTTPLHISDLDPDQTYYFRFFPYTTANVFTNTQTYKQACSFNTRQYSWNMFSKYLEEYESLSVQTTLLPAAGSSVDDVQYVAADWMLSGSTKIALNTKQKVLENTESLSSFATTWVFMGYNVHVPQYVKYRRYSSELSAWEYIWASSVNDNQVSVDIFSPDGTLFEKRTLLSSESDVPIGWQRPLTAGCRTYTMHYDMFEFDKVYTDTGKKIDNVSDVSFTYSNQGFNATLQYSVPRFIVVDGVEYQFCGYTCTMQSENELNNVLTSNSNQYTCQWDAPENEEISPLNEFPADQPLDDTGYYWKDSAGFHMIDYASSGLAGRPTQDYNGHEVWKKIAADIIEVDTQYYQNDRRYQKGDVHMTPILPFEFNVPYYASNTYKAYNPGTLETTHIAWYNNIVNDFVQYDGAIYKCIKNVASTNTTVLPTDTSYFTLVTDYVIGENAYLVGSKIDEGIIELNASYCKTNGKNVYSLSNYKQYCNFNGGSAERSYAALNKFDNFSTNAWYTNANGMPLKLCKEPEFMQCIVPVSNVTAVSNITHSYCKSTGWNGSWREYVIDKYFWPLSQYEAQTAFKNIYPDNAHRIKYYYINANGEVSTSAYSWWLRSPYVAHSYYVYLVYPSGAINYYNANNSTTFSPACLIG